MTSTVIELPDESATNALAARIAHQLPEDRGGWMLLLQGELGAGKSTLAREMLRQLGHTGHVPSPTYTLVEPYDLASGIIYHIDLYRISSFEELGFLGWQDLRDGMILLEWPERAPELMGQADLLLRLEYDGPGRRAELRPLSTRALRQFTDFAAGD